MLNFAQNRFVSRWIWLFCAVFLLLPISTKAAENYSPSELDTLVSTIALYPDPLLVQVLAASTYGEQIAGANNWAQAHKHLSGETLAKEMEKANLPYDPSVQALIPFPSILATMDKYKTWSDQLGDAVSIQKDEVMDAIQRLRNAAYDHGQLKTDDQVRVEKGTSIIIEPVRTEYVYVPTYNPRVVYYVYADFPSIRYHHHAWLGSWYGEWGWGSCWFEWDSHFIYVRDFRWYHHRPIPHHPPRYNPPPRHHLEPVRGPSRPRAESRWNSNEPVGTVKPSGHVFRKQEEQHLETVRKKLNAVEQKETPGSSSSFVASSGNRSRRTSVDSESENYGVIRSTEPTIPSPEYGNGSFSPGYERSDSRRNAPSAPSSGDGGGFRKSKRR